MPFFGSFGGSQISKGVGGYHPGVGPIDTAGSSAAGSLGTTTVNGDSSATSVSGQRTTFDPYNNGAISYAIVSGTLPPGFSLNGSNGTVSGSYTVQGQNSDGTVYTFTVRATTAGVPNTTDRTYTITLSTPWRYRQIINYNYHTGGYKNSALWSNVNRFTVSTDTCVNLGDGNIDNYHYKSGASGNSRVYIWNGGTTAFNMRTESKQNSFSGGGGGGNNGTAFNERNYAYITGEGTGQIIKWSFSTESNSTGLGSGWNSHAAAISGQDRGIFWGNSGETQRVYFPTDAIANMGYSAGCHGQQKGMNAKTGYGYGGNEGDYAAGYNFRRTLIASEAGSNTYSKPGGWGYGEENYGMGQNKGYLFGQHDPSGQNNRSWAYTYATESGYQNGSSMEPKGHDGCSSGHVGWRD
jgi:hypothetical protein